MKYFIWLQSSLPRLPTCYFILRAAACTHHGQAKLSLFLNSIGILNHMIRHNSVILLLQESLLRGKSCKSLLDILSWIFFGSLHMKC